MEHLRDAVAASDISALHHSDAVPCQLTSLDVPSLSTRIECGVDDEGSEVELTSGSLASLENGLESSKNGCLQFLYLLVCSSLLVQSL